MAMKIEKQSIKFIKPLVQTPPTLSHYKLGFTDEFAPAIDAGVVLFFSNHNPTFVAKLEHSLAKTLTRLYPLAGRYVEETRSVDCNDQGAEFTYAKVDIKLQDFLVSDVNNVKFIDDFIPWIIGASPLLATQVTTFKCGGVAIGVNATHKMVDASTLCTIINEWAIANREQNESEFTGSGFNSSILFPARGLTMFPAPPMSQEILRKQYTRKKLSFSENMIINMRAKRNNISSRRWSKVQLLSAIIWKAFMDVDLAKHNHVRESTLIQTVSLRGKMGSTVPKDSCGNLWGFCVTKCETPEATTEELTDRLSDSVKKVVHNLSKGHRDHDEEQATVLNLLLNVYNVSESSNVVTTSSWCKFPYYEADFGFGKPVWAAPGTLVINQSAYMMDDANGNGVEAHVFLQVKDVPYFEEALQHVNAFRA